MSKRLDILSELLAPIVTALGYEFWGCEYLSQGKHSLLRVYIDSDDGINVDDCAKVSMQISAVLDVEDPIKTEYSLEVSSPGLDRPFYTLEQIARYVGHKVRIKTRIPYEKRRNFLGNLVATQGNKVVVEVEKQQYELDFADVEKANLVALENV
ncbi:MAG: ribosome maturation factor RimP [Gammaproteobacteria bacterium]